MAHVNDFAIVRVLVVLCIGYLAPIKFGKGVGRVLAPVDVVDTVCLVVVAENIK